MAPLLKFLNPLRHNLVRATRTSSVEQIFFPFARHLQRMRAPVAQPSRLVGQIETSLGTEFWFATRPETKFTVTRRKQTVASLLVRDIFQPLPASLPTRKIACARRGDA